MPRVTRCSITIPEHHLCGKKFVMETHMIEELPLPGDPGVCPRLGVSSAYLKQLGVEWSALYSCSDQPILTASLAHDYSMLQPDR